MKIIRDFGIGGKAYRVIKVDGVYILQKWSGYYEKYVSNVVLENVDDDLEAFLFAKHHIRQEIKEKIVKQKNRKE